MISGKSIAICSKIRVKQENNQKMLQLVSHIANKEVIYRLFPCIAIMFLL